MSELAKRDENREKGEIRTQAILSDSFWILKRSVDIEGADFLLQIPGESLDELWERKKRIQVLGIVQAKYFEGKNQVRIARDYVEDKSGIPWTEFFGFLHTNKDVGEHIDYFFTAQEIQKEFSLSSDSKYYCFSITKDRDYVKHRNLNKSNIIDTIKNGILNTEEERNKAFIRVIYSERIVSQVYTHNKKIFETEDSIHELRQVGNTIEIVKKSKASGAEAIIGTKLGNINNISYNPITGCISNAFEDV